jgi:CubicO group peptidase (beta-lactamase class C family)
VVGLALLSACSGSSSDDGEPGPSRADRADALFERIGPSDPFCTAAVLDDGQVVFAEGYGSLGGEPVDEDTPVDIASVSKQFTGVAIELLIDRGELAGDDLVGELVPASSPATDDVTVDELLTHTSGLRDYTDLLTQEFDEPSDQADAIAAIADTRPTRARGRFEYSNSNYVLLAEVVEAVSGQPFARFLADEVFGPLELDMAVDPIGPWTQVGDGSVQTTPTELVTWSQQYWDQTLEGPDLATVMFDPEVDASEGTEDVDDTYGSGILRATTEDGELVLFHDGSWDYETDWVLLPDQRLAAAVTCAETADLDTDAPAEDLLAIWHP